MSISDRTVASVLKQFANSVDHVDDDTFQRVGDQVKKYVAKQLNIDFFDFQVAMPIDDIDDERQSLRTVWASADEDRLKTNPRTIFVVGEDGERSYRNQSAYSFDTGRPLWLVCRDMKPSL